MISCCYNQAALRRAIEAYTQDTGKTIDRLSSHSLQTLADTGYIRTIPDDPGAGRATWDHYVLSPDGQVGCIHHGFIEPPMHAGLSAYDQLAASGIDDPEILDRASRKSPSVLHGGPLALGTPSAHDRHPLHLRSLSYTQWSFVLLFSYIPLAAYRLRRLRPHRLRPFGLALGLAALASVLFSPTMGLAFLIIAFMIVSVELFCFALLLMVHSNPSHMVFDPEWASSCQLTTTQRNSLVGLLERCQKRYLVSAGATMLTAIGGFVGIATWIGYHRLLWPNPIMKLQVIAAIILAGALSGAMRYALSADAIRQSSGLSDGTQPTLRSWTLTLILGALSTHMLVHMAKDLLIDNTFVHPADLSLAWGHSSLILFCASCFLCARYVSAARLYWAFAEELPTTKGLH